MLNETYPRHDRAGGDGSTFADNTVRQDDSSRANIYVVFNDDGAGNKRRLAALSRKWIVADGVTTEVDVLADVDSAADENIARVFHSAVCANVNVVGNVNVVAVVAGEGVVDDHA